MQKICFAVQVIRITSTVSEQIKLVMRGSTVYCFITYEFCMKTILHSQVILHSAVVNRLRILSIKSIVITE